MSEQNKELDETQILKVMEKLYESAGEGELESSLRNQVHELEQRVKDTEGNIEQNSDELEDIVNQIDTINKRINTLEASIDAVRQMTQDSAAAKSKIIEQIIILAVGGLITAVGSQVVR